MWLKMACRWCACGNADSAGNIVPGGGSIVKFRVWLGGVEQAVVAVDNAATLNFDAGAKGFLSIEVRAVDGYGHESVPVCVQAEVLGRGSRIENKATLIGPYTWNGEQKYVAVLDAAYRSAAAWGKSSMDTTMPNVAAVWGAVTDWSEAALEVCASAETQNSQQNTDILMTLNTGTDSVGNVGTPAAAHCHGQSLVGQSCQLPSLKALLRVYKEREFLDAHDPSVAANSDKALSQWGFKPPNVYVFSSSEFSRSAAVALSAQGEIQAYQKFNVSGVIPVLEL